MLKKTIKPPVDILRHKIGIRNVVTLLARAIKDLTIREKSTHYSLTGKHC